MCKVNDGHKEVAERTSKTPRTFLRSDLQVAIASFSRLWFLVCKNWVTTLRLPRFTIFLWISSVVLCDRKMCQAL